MLVNDMAGQMRPRRPGRRRGARRPRKPREEEVEEWIPKSDLGKSIFAGKEVNIDKLFANGVKIREAQIVDRLLPNVKNEVIMIGGSCGKGGGSKRTLSRRTSRMHKSGRRYRISVMSVVGNENGYVGLGLSRGPVGKHRDVMKKAISKAKLNIVPVRRGCGSWECRCGGSHSIPFTTMGTAGSVTVKLMPAPKGLGLCVSNEVKKVLRLAGIKDVWCKVRGKSQTRVNLIKAVFDALGKMNSYRVISEYETRTGMVTGRGD
jgi:small subunit ribosomal protein S5